jgi:amino-acid N-acetyltransferase
MQPDSTVIRKAEQADLDDHQGLLALLTRVELPHEGVSEHLHNFFVARDQEGQLIGSAGLERYGSLALLRSVAVSPEYQYSGAWVKADCHTARLRGAAGDRRCGAVDYNSAGFLRQSFRL